MSTDRLVCRECGWVTPAAEPAPGCPACGSRLEIDLAAYPDALAAVRKSGGRPTVVERDLLKRALQTAGRDSVFLEPASALAAGGAVKLTREADELDTVVAVGSGAGAGWPEKTTEVLGEHPTVEPTLTAVADAVPFGLE